MAAFPAPGDLPYSDKLQAYIDAADEETRLGAAAAAAEYLDEVTPTLLGMTDAQGAALLDAENSLMRASLGNVITSELISSFEGLTLSAAAPEVPTLGNVNEWLVQNPVTLELPVVPIGSQFTVHVVDGFQHISWPVLTEIFGSTSGSEAWITLIRAEANWIVLVPSSGGSGLVDVEEVTVLNAISMGGTFLQYNAGNATMIGAGWAAFESGGFGSVTIGVRRTGNQAIFNLIGFKAGASAGALMAKIPIPAGASFDNLTTSHTVPGTLADGSVVPFNIMVRANVNQGLLEFYSATRTAGTYLGQLNPVGSNTTTVSISRSISALSTWGI